MATCEVCGNDYDKAFNVTLMDGAKHTFDSFECAIHALAPRCALQLPHRRTRRGKKRHVLLLRALRRTRGREGPARPGVSGDVWPG